MFKTKQKITIDYKVSDQSIGEQYGQVEGGIYECYDINVEGRCNTTGGNKHRYYHWDDVIEFVNNNLGCVTLSGIEYGLQKNLAIIIARDLKIHTPVDNVYWFPNHINNEIYLLEVTENTCISLGRRVEPYYYSETLNGYGREVSVGLAIIRPEEFGKVSLPDRWGSWLDAVSLEEYVING
jgi:hypothetical protein